MAQLGNIEAVQEVLEENAVAVRSKAFEIRVVDQTSLDYAAVVLAKIKDHRKMIDDEMGPTIKSAHETHKRLINLKKRAEAPLTEAEARVKKSVADYYAEIRQKQERERAKALEEERRLKKEEEDRRVAEAVALEKAGKKEEAEKAISAPTHIAPVRVETKMPEKADNLSIRKIYGYAIVNEFKIPREYLIPNEKKILASVKAMKEETKIPGVEVRIKESVAVRG